MAMETLPPDRFLGPKRYKIKCRCTRCGHRYSYVSERLTDKDPPCPKAACIEATILEATRRGEENMRRMFEEERAPGHIGNNVQNRAIDATAQIVMEDHKLTDLKDNVRAGESLAPKLPGEQQKIADGFFGGAAVREKVGIPKRQMDLIGRRAMAGAFRSMALNVGEVQRPYKGQSPLERVGTEKLRDSR